MIGQIFAVIELLLKLIGLWGQFSDYVDKKRTAEAEERRQRRDQAVDDLKNAKTEEEFNEAQSRIVNNPP